MLLAWLGNLEGPEGRERRFTNENYGRRITNLDGIKAKLFNKRIIG